MIRPGSTGRVVPGYEARCVDSHGAEMPGVRSAGLRFAVRLVAAIWPISTVSALHVEEGRTSPVTVREDADGYFWYMGARMT